MAVQERPLEGRTAIVTGGGRGIGAATARVLARDGAKVLVVSRTREELAATTETIRSEGGVAEFFAADVRDEDQVEAAVAATIQHFGALHLAYNAAGVGAGGQIDVTTLDAAVFDEVLDGNLRSTWLSIKHQAVAIEKAGGGAIVNTSSVASIITATRTGVYGAAKAGIDRLTQIAARQLAPRGIRVNAVLPGAVDTALLKGDRALGPGPDGSQIVTPLGRVGRPEEIGEAVAWLLSERASYVAGALLVVDGGRSS